MKTVPLARRRGAGLLAALRADAADKLRHLRTHATFDHAWHAATLGLGLWLVACAGAALGLLAVTSAIYPVTLASAAALYALGVCAEKAFPNASEVRSTRLLAFGALAGLSFFAHAQAQAEVNEIFHVDAAAFPHATTAATVFIVLSWLFWPAVAAIAASLAGAAHSVHRKSAGAAVTGLTVLLGSATIAGAVGLQLLDGAARANDIYQVARALDFNERFECDRGIPGIDGAAFIGTEQSRALIAPRLAEAPRGAGSFFRRVRVPTRFEVATCR